MKGNPSPISDGNLARTVVIVFVIGLLVVAGFTQLQRLYSPGGQTTGVQVNPAKVPGALSAGMGNLLPILSTGASGSSLVDQSRTITVSGSGKASATPDEVKVYFDVQTKDSKAADAQQENAQTMQKVHDALVALGITDSQLETTSFSVQPQYQYTGGSEILDGFQATQSTQIDLGKDTADVGKVLDAIGNAGGQVSSVSFELSDATRAQLEQQALAAAGADASGQASALAGALGVKVTQLLSASTQSLNLPEPYPVYERMGGAMAVPASASTQVSPGTVEVSASVNAVYEIQ